MRKIFVRAPNGIFSQLPMEKILVMVWAGPLSGLLRKQVFSALTKIRYKHLQNLFEWAKQNIKGINLEFVPQEAYIEANDFLKDRMKKALTIQGMRKYHAFMPTRNRSNLCVKFFSSSSKMFEPRVEPEIAVLSFGEMFGYVITVYEEKWWIGYVLDKNDEEEVLQISFLHPNGPSPSFKFPSRVDRLRCSASDVIVIVHPITPTDRIYNLAEEETLRAIQTFEMKPEISRERQR